MKLQLTVNWLCNLAFQFRSEVSHSSFPISVSIIDHKKMRMIRIER